MSFKPIFRFRNPDSTLDLNTAYSSAIDKGIYSGGDLSVSSTSLVVTVAPFTAVGYDGLVVKSDSSISVTVLNNQVNVIALYAKYERNADPVINVKVYNEAALTSSLDYNYFIIFGRIDLTAGGYVGVLHESVTAPPSGVGVLSTRTSHYATKIGRVGIKQAVSDAQHLPVTKNQDGDIRYTLAEKALYAWDPDTRTWNNILSTNSSAVIYDGGPTWADGSTNPATVVETQLDKIVTDLGSGSGTNKIAVGLIAGSPVNIPAGTLTQALTNLLVGVNDRGVLTDANTWTDPNTFTDTVVFDGTLTANGVTEFTNDVDFNTGTVTISDGVAVTNGIVTDNLDVSVLSTLDTLVVNNTATFNSTSEFNDTITVATGNIVVSTGDISSVNSTVSGVANINNLTVSGTSSFSLASTFNNIATFNSTALFKSTATFQTGTVTFSNGFNASALATFNSTVNFNGSSTFNGLLTSSNTANFNSLVNFNGNINNIKVQTGKIYTGNIAPAAATDILSANNTYTVGNYYFTTVKNYWRTIPLTTGKGDGQWFLFIDGSTIYWHSDTPNPNRVLYLPINSVCSSEAVIQQVRVSYLQNDNDLGATVKIVRFNFAYPTTATTLATGNIPADDNGNNVALIDAAAVTYQPYAGTYYVKIDTGPNQNATLTITSVVVTFDIDLVTPG